MKNHNASQAILGKTCQPLEAKSLHTSHNKPIIIKVSDPETDIMSFREKTYAVMHPDKTSDIYIINRNY